MSGDVNFVSQANATASQLAFVNAAGHAIVKVDNTSFVPFNFKRNSVSSSDTSVRAVHALTSDAGQDHLA